MRNLFKSATVFFFLASVIIIQEFRIRNILKEKDRLQLNNEAFLNDIKLYKNKDSINVAKINSIILTNSEYKKNRQKDFNFIKSLNINNRDLKSISKSAYVSKYPLEGIAKDTIIKIVVEGVSFNDSLKCVNQKNKWYNLEGCIDRRNNFYGEFNTVDSIMYVETIKYKRFLGFLWKTNKIKDRQQDILNKNPYSKILSAEYIIIEK